MSRVVMDNHNECPECHNITLPVSVKGNVVCCVDCARIVTNKGEIIGEYTLEGIIYFNKKDDLKTGLKTSHEVQLSKYLAIMNTEQKAQVLTFIETNIRMEV